MLFREVQGTIVFLSLAENRFFSLSSERENAFRRSLGMEHPLRGECFLQASGAIVHRELDHQSRDEPVMALMASFGEADMAVRVRDYVGALWVRRTMRRLVAKGQLETIQARLEALRRKQTDLYLDWN